MVALALVMRPWILIMTGLKVIPGTLADDVMILACEDDLHSEIEHEGQHLSPITRDREDHGGETVIGIAHGLKKNIVDATWALKAKFRIGFQTTLAFFQDMGARIALKSPLPSPHVMEPKDGSRNNGGTSKEITTSFKSSPTRET